MIQSIKINILSMFELTSPMRVNQGALELQYSLKATFSSYGNTGRWPAEK